MHNLLRSTNLGFLGDRKMTAGGGEFSSTFLNSSTVNAFHSNEHLHQKLVLLHNYFLSYHSRHNEKHQFEKIAFKV